ncbi:hypothetical protein JCM10212_002567 [Sporobolomyces blumeae]
MPSRRVIYLHSDALIDAADALPSNQGRASLVHSLCSAFDLLDVDQNDPAATTHRATLVEPVQASRTELCAFHDEGFVDSETDQDERPASRSKRRKTTHPSGLEDDCPTFPLLPEYASLVAGASLTAARYLRDGRADVAISWNGGRHHAGRSEAAGFCYVNDIVLALMELRSKPNPLSKTSTSGHASEDEDYSDASSRIPPRPLSKRLSKILYLDFDLHHGDAVEAAFNSSPNTLTVSWHLHAPLFYPSSGALSDSGPSNPKSPGRGHALNLALEPGFGEEAVVERMWNVVEDVRDAYGPDAVVVQCGVDGLAGDPCKEWNLSLASLAKCVGAVLDWDLPTLLLGGGGYDSPNAARAWTYLTSVALGRPLPLESSIPASLSTDHYGQFAPSFTLDVPRIEGMRDRNDELTLSRVEAKFAEYVEHLRSRWNRPKQVSADRMDGEGLEAGQATAKKRYTVPKEFLDLEREFKKERGLKDASRKQRKLKEIEEDVDELESASEDASPVSASTSSSKKRRAPSSGKAAHETGKSEIKGPSPLDRTADELILEISSYVDHEQLYYLSQLSKRLHRLLGPSNDASSSIERLWARARAASGLTDTDGLDEREFAHVLWGKTCYFCSSSEGSADPFLRKVLCRTCRKERLVNVEKLTRGASPDLDPHARWCTIATRLNMFGSYHATNRYVLKDSVKVHSDELERRHARDVDDAELETWAALQGDDRARRMAVPEYIEVECLVQGKSRDRYFKRRSKEVDRRLAWGEGVWHALEAKKTEASRIKARREDERRAEVERRVLALGGDYTAQDFTAPHWENHALVTKGPSRIDDHEWKKLKPKVIKLITQCRKLKANQDAQIHRSARLDDLRRYFDKIRDDDNFFPLFADFAALPSMQAVIDAYPDATKVTRAQMHDAVEWLEADLNDWSVDTRLAAIQLVLARTLDMEEDEELDSDADAYDDDSFDDGFFNLAASFLCCDIPGCSTPFFGSLLGLFAHQHQQHTQLLPTHPDKATHARFSLPLEVATAMSAIFELCDLDDATATGEMVDEAMRGKQLQWENLPSGGAGRKQDDWRKVIARIKVEADKCAKKGTCFIPRLALFDVNEGPKRKR